MRINSAGKSVASLEKIATDVEDEEAPSVMKEAGEKVPKILSRVADQLASVRGARVIIAGIISLVAGGAGYPASAVADNQ